MARSKLLVCDGKLVQLTSLHKLLGTTRMESQMGNGNWNPTGVYMVYLVVLTGE